MLPTPTAHDGSSNGISAASRQGGPSLLDRLRLLPTPTASDAKASTHLGQDGGPSLSDQCRMLQEPAVFLPTPRATDGTKGCPAQRGSKGDLMLPSAIIQLLSHHTTGGTF
jgi:DNA (cytosine-5)-methyltransferase 1